MLNSKSAFVFVGSFVAGSLAAGCHPLMRLYRPASQAPQSAAQQAAAQLGRPKSRVVVAATNRGFTVDGKAVARTAIKPMLLARLAQSPNTEVIISCSRDRQIEDFEYLLDQVKQTNAVNVYIATKPEPDFQEKR